MVEYYFQDQVRWSFGFENPNKAAALIASLLPLLWVVGALSWRITSKPKRAFTLSLGGITLCAGWWLLFLTFSRGGILAAAAAFVYIGWRERERLLSNRVRKLVALGTALMVVALFALTDAAQRSTQWMGKRDGSVVNRLDVWRGGLEMIASVPGGVGWGQSGAFYMQWFQPLEATTRYRTLVNSYLTFAAEGGLALFGVALFLALLLWRSTAHLDVAAAPTILATAARASLLGFCVAGLFSTTMEDWRLWGVPALATAYLVGCRLRRKGEERLRPIPAFVGSLVGCLALYVAGTLSAAKAPVRISIKDEHVVIMPRQPRGESEFAVWVDETVLGEDYGKLLRHLAIASGRIVEVDGDGRNGTLIITGERIAALDSARARLCLIAPTRLEPEKALRIFQSSSSVMLLTPSFDEDGRVGFWNQSAAQAGITPARLDGVGSEVASAWLQIIKKVLSVRSPP